MFSIAIVRHIPNTLSLFRLGLAILFPFVQGRGWAMCVVLAAGLSDLADGLIARRFGVTSWIGGHLDAIADKTFVLVALLTYVGRDHIQYWQVVLLVSRDMAVLGISAYAVIMGQWSAFKRMPSRGLGRLATAAILCFILALAVDLASASFTASFLFPMATGLSLAAAIDYVMQAIGAQQARSRL